MQWAPPKSSALPHLVDRVVRLRPAQAWLLILGCTDAAVLGDRLTGPDLWFGPVYLLVICLAAWSRGWRGGQLTGVCCMALTFAINGRDLYPYAGEDFAWSLGTRFLAVTVIIAVIASVRGAYVREWWQARTDILTGALNRQAFFELAPSANDTQRWRLLAYADLDGLKQVNDKQGHAAGDACLKAYGTTVRHIIRRHDIFARVGGDEFLIFMNVKDEAAARAVASRLHQAVNGIAAHRSRLKCSVGGLLVPPGDASMDDLVRSADNLMYEAKLRGASLQLGIASQVERPALGRARARSRGSAWGLSGKESPVERRAESMDNFARESLPR
jgi:diguanylate cyclase (GGDEF)-like protein